MNWHFASFSIFLWLSHVDFVFVLVCALCVHLSYIQYACTKYSKIVDKFNENSQEFSQVLSLHFEPLRFNQTTVHTHTWLHIQMQWNQWGWKTGRIKQIDKEDGRSEMQASERARTHTANKRTKAPKAAPAAGWWKWGRAKKRGRVIYYNNNQLIIYTMHKWIKLYCVPF